MYNVSVTYELVLVRTYAIRVSKSILSNRNGDRVICPHKKKEKEGERTRINHRNDNDCHFCYFNMYLYMSYVYVKIRLGAAPAHARVYVYTTRAHTGPRRHARAPTCRRPPKQTQTPHPTAWAYCPQAEYSTVHCISINQCCQWYQYQY